MQYRNTGLPKIQYQPSKPCGCEDNVRQRSTQYLAHRKGLHVDINFRPRSSLASEPLQENDLHWRVSPATPKFFPQGHVSDTTILGGTFRKS